MGGDGLGPGQDLVEFLGREVLAVEIFAAVHHDGEMQHFDTGAFQQIRGDIGGRIDQKFDACHGEPPHKYLYVHMPPQAETKERIKLKSLYHFQRKKEEGNF